MRRTPLLLDLYCCQGGASVGYQVAGFDVIGVDISPQPRYPYPFVQDDALDVLRRLMHADRVAFLGYEAYNPDEGHKIIRLGQLDAIHASPPCQAHSKAQKIRSNSHPDLIGPTRNLLEQIGLPYVIENVPGAPLRNPVKLCGAMFGLETYRHRLFETNWPLTVPEHPEHTARTTKMGRPVRPGEYMHVVGNFSGVARAREVMDMQWANRDGLREAIPPAYTRYIGRQLLDQISPVTGGAFLCPEEAT